MTEFLLGLPVLADGALWRTARRLGAPVLVSANALSVWRTDRLGLRHWAGFSRRNLRLVAQHPVMLDSGGFVAAARYNGWEWTVPQYMALCAAAPWTRFASMDWCVEPEVAGDHDAVLEGQPGFHDVHYAHENIAGRVDATLRDLGGPAGLRGLPPDAFAGRMARLYGDLDFAHSFYEGNSRTLREFTRSLAAQAGYELNWAPTGADATQRNRLYVARDIAVLERAYPGLTPERGMQTDDRYEYEASLALPALRRSGPTLEVVIREGLTALPATRQEAAPTSPTSPALASGRGAFDLALDAQAQHLRQSPSPDAPPTPMGERLRRKEDAKSAPSPDPPSAKPEEPKPSTPGHRSSGPGF